MLFDPTVVNTQQSSCTFLNKVTELFHPSFNRFNLLRWIFTIRRLLWLPSSLNNWHGPYSYLLFTSSFVMLIPIKYILVTGDQGHRWPAAGLLRRSLQPLVISPRKDYRAWKMEEKKRRRDSFPDVKQQWGWGMQEDKAREELTWGAAQVVVCSSLVGVRVKLCWWQGLGLGTSAGCLFSPLHVANLCKLKKISYSSVLFQVSGSVDEWEAAMSSR